MNSIKAGSRNPDEQNRKVFIGGLSYTTSDETLKEFYSQWGDVIDCIVMRDAATKRSRGFGFVTYSEATMLDEAMKNRPHSIDGKVVEPKRAVPREDSSKPENHMSVRKLYISGVRDELTEEMFKEHFSKYGTVEDVELITDKQSGQRRGFGFILFNDYDAVDKLQRSHIIGGKRCDVKKALSKDEMRKFEEQERDRAARSDRSKSGYDQRSNGPPPGQGGPPGGWGTGPSQGGWNQGPPQSGWQQGGPQGGSWTQGGWQGPPNGWTQQGGWQPATGGYGGGYNYNASQGYPQGQGWGPQAGWGQAPEQAAAQHAGSTPGVPSQNYGTGGYSYGTNFQSGGWRSHGPESGPQPPSTGSNGWTGQGQANGVATGGSTASTVTQQQGQLQQSGHQATAPTAQWSAAKQQEQLQWNVQQAVAKVQQPGAIEAQGQPVVYGTAINGQQGYGYVARA